MNLWPIEQRKKALSYTRVTPADWTTEASTRDEERTPRMPTKRSAIDALRKLEADRQALDERQRELEEKATLELGQLILGSGVEAFSRKGLRQASEMLGKLGEAEALRRLGSEPAASRHSGTPAAS